MRALCAPEIYLNRKNMKTYFQELAKIRKQKILAWVCLKKLRTLKNMCFFPVKDSSPLPMFNLALRTYKKNLSCGIPIGNHAPSLKIISQ